MKEKNERIFGKIEIVTGWVLGIAFLIVAIMEKNLVVGGMAFIVWGVLNGVGKGHLEPKKETTSTTS